MKKTATILYVEDNLENRILIRRILQAEGFHMLEAENAYQALSLIRTSSPDLILMDINMPGLDGYSLTEQLKSQPAHRNIPIIALTANVMKGDRERTIKAGCDGYIQKPIDVDLLPFQVRTYLER
jgi:two-component system cell cycle response regulator DivK